MWRSRPGKQQHENGHFPQPVYYNTTGVVVNGIVRQRPKICGYARFDVVGGFDPNRPPRMIHRVFECAEPSVWMGCNKLLFRRILTTIEPPSRYLVIARSNTHGLLRVGNGQWRSPDSWLVAFSEDGGQQEAMLLLGSDGWIERIWAYLCSTFRNPAPGRRALCFAVWQIERLRPCVIGRDPFRSARREITRCCDRFSIQDPLPTISRSSF
jgi:hypothetical protein